jgi:hypothetical protein
MELCDALIEAEVQLDWGTRPDAVARALSHLVAVAPECALVRPLQMKLVVLRLADELRRL